MALHLLKLCVGADSIADLEEWIEETRLQYQRLGREYRQLHTTRMVPTRKAELLAGGSLYWVIKGRVAARQRMLDIEPFVDFDGISRCHLVLEPIVHPIEMRPFRPFQGWRYLMESDAPRDIRKGEPSADMPEAMRAELASLGLL